MSVGIIETPVRLGVEIIREDEHANRPCSICRRRRVRYRVVVHSMPKGSDATDARCIECWTAGLVQPTLSAMQRTDGDG